MTIDKILNTTDHRSWAMPQGKWKFYQEWNNVIFLHWEVELYELEKVIPEHLEIDLYKGKPWVSLVAFTMEKVRPRYLPSFSPISNFDEVNIRTYVKSNNKPGVYFLSIEGGKRLSCELAKQISGLPYQHSNIKRSKTYFESKNSINGDILKMDFSIRDDVNYKTSLDKWLTERYALFQNSKESINEFDIHHMEWPINNIDLNELDFRYQKFGKLLNSKPNKMQYSKGLKVLAWGKKKGS